MLVAWMDTGIGWFGAWGMAEFPGVVSYFSPKAECHAGGGACSSARRISGLQSEV